MKTHGNAALQALLKDAGKKARAIRSTAYTILLNRPEIKTAVTLDDIEFVTIEGTDMMKVRMYNSRMKNYYYRYYVTEPVEIVVITENDYDIIPPDLLSM